MHSEYSLFWPPLIFTQLFPSPRRCYPRFKGTVLKIMPAWPDPWTRRNTQGKEPAFAKPVAPRGHPSPGQTGWLASVGKLRRSSQHRHSLLPSKAPLNSTLSRTSG